MERTGPARADTCNKESVSILISIIVLSPGVDLKQWFPVLIIYNVLKLCRTRVRHHCSPGRTSAWGRLKCTLNFFFFFRGSIDTYLLTRSLTSKCLSSIELSTLGYLPFYRHYLSHRQPVQVHCCGSSLLVLWLPVLWPTHLQSFFRLCRLYVIRRVLSTSTH